MQDLFMRCKHTVSPFRAYHFVLVAISANIANETLADVDYRVESKIHYRSSDSNRFVSQFPFPPSFLPEGASQAFVETVDAGDHVELSTMNLAGKWQLDDSWSLRARIEIIDKYDRNPTSTDQKIDLDQFIVRYGRNPSPMEVSDNTNFYAQIGKFTKFERQLARRTESYGLLSTAFNRFEDSGIEAGIDWASGLYGKLSWTTGNPVFIRDPNVLAGDNGTSERNVPPENPDPDLKSGIVILYDAEIEDFDLGGDSELGGALGYRWNSADRRQRLDIMLFAYERTLKEERDLNNTFYGADLDILDLGDVPGAEGIRLPAVGNKKTEQGVNLWYQAGNFAFFGQYVKQDIAELGRSGIEVELSYVFDIKTPITPVIRYSNIDNDFIGSPFYPAPSVWWDWSKIDIGLNIDITNELRITVEHSMNDFELTSGAEGSNDESLITFRWLVKP